VFTESPAHNQAANLETHGGDDLALREHAEAIRHLGKRTVNQVVEIGQRLTECKRIVGRGNWLPFLEREFGWSERTARNFMRLSDMAKSETVSDLNLPFRALYLLAAPSTPKEVRAEVIARSKAGETVSVAEVGKAIDERKTVDVSHPHVAKVRKQAEKAGDVETATTSIDTRGRAQPVRKPRAKTEARPTEVRERGLENLRRTIDTMLSVADDDPEHSRLVIDGVWRTIDELIGSGRRIGADTGPNSAGEAERLRARVDELQTEVRQRDIKIVGLESEIGELKAKIENLQTENARLCTALAANGAAVAIDDAIPDFSRRH
jgi:hypothetical protein